VSERGSARRHEAVPPDRASEEQDRSLVPPVDLTIAGAIVWRCPEESCEYRELGRVERASGDGVCREHGEPLVRVNG
jgi:hypothetical protein